MDYQLYQLYDGQAMLLMFVPSKGVFFHFLPCIARGCIFPDYTENTSNANLQKGKCSVRGHPFPWSGMVVRFFYPVKFPRYGDPFPGTDAMARCTRCDGPFPGAVTRCGDPISLQ